MTRIENSTTYSATSILLRITLISLFTLITLQDSHAQLMQAGGAGSKAIHLGISSDAFTGVALGYSQSADFQKLNGMFFYARFSIPLLLVMKDKSLSSSEVDLGINSGFIGHGKVGVLADLHLYAMHHHQVLGTFFPMGFNLRLVPSYRFPKGYMGFQCTWNQTLATHIAHSDYVKQTFTEIEPGGNQNKDSGPDDGWYSNTGSHLGFGIEGGRAMGSRYFIEMDLGMLKFSSPYTGMMDAMSMGQVPIYMHMRLHYRL